MSGFRIFTDNGPKLQSWQSQTLIFLIFKDLVSAVEHLKKFLQNLFFYFPELRGPRKKEYEDL